MANADGSVVIRVDADDKKAIKKLDDVAKKANDVRKSLDGKSILINTDVSQAEREIDRLRASIGKLEEDIRVKERLALETQNAKAISPFRNEQYRNQEDKATKKPNCYQKVIICTSEPRRLIFDYCGAISALPGDVLL